MMTAWGDESQSNSMLDPGTYILGAALVLDDNIETIRDGMTQLLRRGTRKLRWHDEVARHRQVIDAIAELPVEGFVVVRRAQGDRSERSRRKCLEVLLPELHALGCTALTLESRGLVDDRRDMKAVQTLQWQKNPGGAVRLLHEVGPKQPLLWVADAMCGAVVRDRCGESAYLDRLVARVTVRVIEGRR